MKHGILALLVLVAWVPGAAQAAVFNVASGDTAGFASALATANANGEADTIDLAAGTYDLTGTLVVSSEIAIVGAGAGTTTIQRSVLPAFSLLRVSSDGDLRIEGVTLANGGGSAFSLGGGAIELRGHRLSVKDCVFSGNLAESGGAIYALSTGAELEVEGSTFAGNFGRLGSAIGSHSLANVSIRDSQFTGNTGSVALDLFGTGIVRIADCLISGNEGGIGADTGVTAPMLLTIERTTISGAGRGISAGGGLGGWMKTFISDSTISGNLGGGGVAAGQGELVIRRSTISGNASDGNGGGVIAFGATKAPGGLTDVTIESSTISGNSAKLSGGGVYVESQLRLGRKLRIRNSTITDNTADADANGSGDGGGIASPLANVEISGTILSGNTDLGGEAPECAGELAAKGYDVIGVTTGCALSGVGLTDQTGVAALLGALAANGGPTETHLPLAGSPAIDRGDDASCPGLDQRGRETRVDGDGDTTPRCDVGAVEAASANAATFFSDPFLCYGAKTSGGTTRLPALTGVALVDDVDGLSYTIDRTDTLCTPASKNGEDVLDEVTHLHGRAIKAASTFAKEKGIRLVNQLGAVTVDAVKPNRLLVPASKDLASPPAPPNPLAHDVDRYKCFQAKISSGTPKLPKGAATLLVGVADQLTRGRALQLSSVSRVCTSTDEQGLGRKNPDAWLVCYKARVDQPLLDAFENVPGAYSATEYGTEQIDLSKRMELCVPSRRVP